MELVEIVTQGLEGAPEMVRVPFNPTVTALPAGVRERLYVRLVLDLLYPKGTEPTLADLDVKNAQSRVALTVRGRDQQLYRLLQDVHTGRRALQRVAGEGKAENITNAANEIAQAVTATLGFPTEDVMRELLFCVREDLPSKKAAAASSSKRSGISKGSKAAAKKKESFNKPLPPGFSDEGAPVVDRARGDAALKERLATIKAELEAQAGIKAVEFEIDGLQKKSFEIDSKLRPLNTLRRSVEQAEQAMQRFHSIEGVPDDIAEKGVVMKKAQAEHDATIARIDEETGRLVESSGVHDRRGRGQTPLEVAQKDPFVLYGAGAGAGAVLLGFVGFLAWPPLQWIAFLDIPAFAVALFGGIRVLASLEHGVVVKRRIERLGQERKRADERLKIDEENVRGVLGKSGFTLEQLPDVEDQIKARTDANVVLAQTKETLNQALDGADIPVLEDEAKAISAKIRALEEQLQGHGYGGVTDLEAEKREIEELLRQGSTTSSSGMSTSEGDAIDAPFGQGGDTDPPGFAEIAGDLSDEGAPVVEIEDAGKRQLELARDVLLAPSIEDVANSVKGRASQILKALTDNRYSEMRFSARAEVAVVDAAAGSAVAFVSLPPGDRDLTFLALKIALIEVVVKRARLPVFFDRGLDALAEAKAPLLKNMLTFLASSTQVISVSEKPALGGRPG